jgi:cell division transport system permease protein
VSSTPARRSGGPGAYLVRHAQVIVYCLGRFSRAPLATLMTTAAIGIALALPTGMYVLLKNAQQVAQQWESAAQISLFMKQHVDEARTRKLASHLRELDDIATVTVIPNSQALDEFRKYSGFGDALDALDGNPLPNVLVVQPRTEFASAASISALLETLKNLPDVEIAQLDTEWLQRLFGIMEIVRRAVIILATLLALSVVFIVSNTIRLEIENRRDEIEITKLIGGTNAFIRRPFLYTGLWHGLFGALLAWLLAELSLYLMTEPVARLSVMYDSSFRLDHMGVQDGVLLLGYGMALGLAGSWIAVGKHLKNIEPT